MFSKIHERCERARDVFAYVHILACMLIILIALGFYVLVSIYKIFWLFFYSVCVYWKLIESSFFAVDCDGFFLLILPVFSSFFFWLRNAFFLSSLQSNAHTTIPIVYIPFYIIHCLAPHHFVTVHGVDAVWFCICALCLSYIIKIAFGIDCSCNVMSS